MGSLAFLALLAAPFISPPALAQSLPMRSNLTVEIEGLKNTQGQVCLSLFESSQGFPNDAEAVVAKQCVAAAPSADSQAAGLAVPLAVTFNDLPSGTYAVSVLHDENADNQVNTGLFGIPSEGFGFSRNPALRMGPPDFSEAAVAVFGRNTTTAIDLIYF